MGANLASRYATWPYDMHEWRLQTQDRGLILALRRAGAFRLLDKTYTWVFAVKAETRADVAATVAAAFEGLDKQTKV